MNLGIKPLIVAVVFGIIATGGIVGYNYIKYMQSEITRLHKERDEAERIAKENAEALEKAASEAENTLDSLKARWQLELRRRKELEKALVEVLNAPPEEDGPVAPVLRRIFRGILPEDIGAKGVGDSKSP